MKCIFDWRRLCFVWLVCFTGWVPTLVKAQPTLTLDEAIGLALKQNFDLAIARNDEDIAQIVNNWGNAGRLPTITGNAGYNISSNNLDQRLSNGTDIKRGGAIFQQQNVGLNTQWRVFNGFRVLASKNRLEEEEKIASVGVRLQANQVVYNVITAYLNLLRFQAQLKATEQSLDLFEQRKTLAENRYNIGVASKVDYLQSVADYNEARNFMITIENNIEQSKVAVNNVLSRNPLEPFVPNDSVTTIPFSSRESMLAALDTLNPAMIIARSQLKVLEQQKREVNSLRLPTVTLNAGASLNNSVNSAGFILRNTTYGPNASVQVAIPIFQGNVIKQNLRVNDVLQKNQTVQIDRLKNDLMSALANAYFNYNNAQRQYQLEQKNLEVVQENNVIGMERFRKASITTVELRQIQINLVESLNRLIIARYTMKQAEADVLLIMGKLVE